MVLKEEGQEGGGKIRLSTSDNTLGLGVGGTIEWIEEGSYCNTKTMV